MEDDVTNIKDQIKTIDEGEPDVLHRLDKKFSIVLIYLLNQIDAVACNTRDIKSHEDVIKELKSVMVFIKWATTAIGAIGVAIASILSFINHKGG